MADNFRAAQVIYYTGERALCTIKGTVGNFEIKSFIFGNKQKKEWKNMLQQWKNISDFSSLEGMNFCNFSRLKVKSHYDEKK